jgi:hypothetical protein
LFGGCDFGETSISVNAQSCVGDIRNGNERRHEFFWAGGEEFAFVSRDKIEPHFHFEPRPQFFSFELRDRLFQKLAIKIETDRDDVAALGGAENAARAADLEIAHRDAKARA